MVYIFFRGLIYFSLSRGTTAAASEHVFQLLFHLFLIFLVTTFVDWIASRLGVNYRLLGCARILLHSSWLLHHHGLLHSWLLHHHWLLLHARLNQNGLLLGKRHALMHRLLLIHGHSRIHHRLLHGHIHVGHWLLTRHHRGSHLWVHHLRLLTHKLRL